MILGFWALDFAGFCPNSQKVQKILAAKSGGLATLLGFCFWRNAVNGARILNESLGSSASSPVSSPDPSRAKGKRQNPKVQNPKSRIRRSRTNSAPGRARGFYADFGFWILDFGFCFCSAGGRAGWGFASARPVLQRALYNMNVVRVGWHQATSRSCGRTSDYILAVRKSSNDHSPRIKPYVPF